ncbi:hypothetical protein ACFL1B_01685, partial [Nanoarchaeota archaeon]
PSASNKGSPGNSPSTYLPNAKISVNIDDLSQAVHAEAIIDLWGGHVGTTGKKFKFNGNSWRTIPELDTTPTSGQCYTHQTNPVISVPLSHLKTGTNTLQGTSGGQTCYNFNWGQWGWYGVNLRVYYSDSKPHPDGIITSHNNGATIGEGPTIKVSASYSAGIEKVEVIAYYEGYDVDGDGYFKEWQTNFRKDQDSKTFELKNIVGSDSTAPYEIKWDTELVPSQSGMKLKARITGKDGTVYETKPVEDITLQRSGSVKLFKPKDVPEKHWVRDGQKKSSKVNIPSLSGATSAKLIVATWNGQANGASHYTKINGWSTPKYGRSHFYSLDVIDVPISKLQSGDNTIQFYAATSHHGIEIMWPGPALIVRYS